MIAVLIATGIYFGVGMVIGLVSVRKLNRSKTGWAALLKDPHVDAIRLYLGDAPFYAFTCLCLVLMCCVAWPAAFARKHS